MALLQFYQAWGELALYWSMLHGFMASRKVTTPGCVEKPVPFLCPRMLAEGTGMKQLSTTVARLTSVP